MIVSGSCLCGRVEFEVSGEPLRADYCHCSRCRKFSGSAADPCLVVATGDLSIRAGQDQLEVYREEGFADRAFCRMCGSSLFAGRELFSGPRVGICMGSLDDDPGVAPALHKGLAWKAPWHTVADDLPRHETWPPAPGAGR